MSKIILHFLCTSSFSGAENVACQIISMCTDDNTEFVYSSPDGQIRKSLEEKNIAYIPMKKLSISEFKRVIDEVKPDIIHAHDMKASLFLALVCKNIPLVSHIHNNNFDSRKISLKSILYYIAARKSKHIFWVSESAFKGYIFHNRIEEKSSILYNVIDIDRLKKKAELDKNEYSYDIIFLGRLSFPKDPIRLMDVFKNVLSKRPETKIAVIGTGELDDEVMAYAKENKLLNNTDFLGFKSNPYKILANSKVMVMTSRYEGLPMCAVEAAALGVPVVSTPTDGLKELIKDGSNGFLSDDNDNLAEKILCILKDAELQKRLSEAQVNYSAVYNDKDKYTEKIISVYGSCL